MKTPLLYMALFSATLMTEAQVTAPATLAGYEYVESSDANRTSRVTLLEADGSFYDVFAYNYRIFTDLPLRFGGSYTYHANGDSTAVLSFSDGTGQTLIFDTPTSGHFSYSTQHPPNFFDPGFSIRPISGSGLLTNISARSLVSSTTPSIAGFIVGGSLPRYYLIRVVGPTLGQYGVTAAVGDPSLELFKGPDKIAENNDWNAQASNGAIMTDIFAKAGAFPLTAGSKDAALLVLLKPGLYSVKGLSAQSGELLVEIYLLP